MAVLSSNLLLATGIEPQAVNQPGAGSDSVSIASKGPDVPPDSAEQPATAPAAGGRKMTSKNGTKNHKITYGCAKVGADSTFHSSSAAEQ